MAHFCISFFDHLIRCIKNTKCAARCSVKSSTIYQRRSQKFAKGGARQQKKFLTVANNFLALYPLQAFFCPSKVSGHLGHPLATPLQSTKQSWFLFCTFCFQKNQNSMQPSFDAAKSGHTEFCFFWKQKLHNQNRLYFVDCRAFHAVSSGVLCFF
jgi:hypothetical protein